jgi:hypothetical protein
LSPDKRIGHSVVNANLASFEVSILNKGQFFPEHFRLLPLHDKADISGVICVASLCTTPQVCRGVYQAAPTLREPVTGRSCFYYIIRLFLLSYPITFIILYMLLSSHRLSDTSYRYSIVSYISPIHANK